MDTEELTQFLAAVGGSWAEGRDPDLSSLAERCGCAPRSAPLLEYRGPSPPWAAREADRLTDVYRLLCASDPSFEKNAPYGPWLCGFSARVRSGRAAAFLCQEGTKRILSIQARKVYRCTLKGEGGVSAVLIILSLCIRCV